MGNTSEETCLCKLVHRRREKALSSFDDPPLAPLVSEIYKSSAAKVLPKFMKSSSELIAVVMAPTVGHSMVEH
ncbi:unnamed protein product [Camellia sinensis]